MVHEFLRSATSPNGHHLGIGNELRSHVVLHRPADDAPRIQVEYRGDIQSTLCRTDIGKVSHPSLAGAIGLQLAVEHANVGNAIQSWLTIVGYGR
jgi:hypothetical protein